jgi:hypothetical protein
VQKDKTPGYEGYKRFIFGQNNGQSEKRKELAVLRRKFKK